MNCNIKIYIQLPMKRKNIKKLTQIVKSNHPKRPKVNSTDIKKIKKVIQ